MRLLHFSGINPQKGYTKKIAKEFFKLLDYMIVISLSISIADETRNWIGTELLPRSGAQ